MPHPRQIGLSHLDYSTFPDGEPDFYPIREVQPRIEGSTVIVFQSGHAARYFAEFKDLIWFCKHQAGAKRVVGVYFFMYGRRQDHGERFSYKVNRNLRYIHELHVSGLDDLILCDIHSQETIRNCRTVGLRATNIDPSSVFADYLKPYVQDVGMNNFLVYSPDMGSVPRAVSLAICLNVKVAVTPKLRRPDGEIEIVDQTEFMDRLQSLFPKWKDMFVPCVKRVMKGKTVVMREDELSTGGTAKTTGFNLRDLGVAQLFFCVTHPVCAPGWKRKLGIQGDEHPFDRIYMGDTIPREYEDRTGGVITTVSMDRLFAGGLFNVLRTNHV